MEEARKRSQFDELLRRETTGSWAWRYPSPTIDTLTANAKRIFRENRNESARELERELVAVSEHGG
jgi:hypothetical protein